MGQIYYSQVILRIQIPDHNKKVLSRKFSLRIRKNSKNEIMRRLILLTKNGNPIAEINKVRSIIVKNLMI